MNNLNQEPSTNEIVKIRLHGKHGGIALVDKENEWLDKFNWYYQEGTGVVRSVIIEGKRRLQLMHRLILNPPSHLVVDHANHNQKDNRLSNIRVCTRQENTRNSAGNTPNKTGYRGVSKNHNKFRARIRIETGVNLHLGNFDTPELASKAYNEAAIKYHKEFAYKTS